MEQEVCLHCVLFNVNLWLTVIHSSCLMTISRSLQFVAKSFPKLLRLINICINSWQIFAVAFLWTTVHYVWWLWLRSSLVGWVVLRACFVGWVGLGPLATGLGWVGSQKMDPRPCLVMTLLIATSWIIHEPTDVGYPSTSWASCIFVNWWVIF